MGHSYVACDVFSVEQKRIQTGKQIFSLITRLINFVLLYAGTAEITPSKNCMLEHWKRLQKLQGSNNEEVEEM